MAGKKDKPDDEFTELSRVYEIVPDPDRPDYHMVKPTTYTQLSQGDTDRHWQVFSGPDAGARATRYCDMVNGEVDADRLASGYIPPVVVFNGARVKTMTISPDDGKASGGANPEPGPGEDVQGPPRPDGPQGVPAHSGAHSVSTASRRRSAERCE